MNLTHPNCLPVLCLADRTCTYLNSLLTCTARCAVCDAVNTDSVAALCNQLVAQRSTTAAFRQPSQALLASDGETRLVDAASIASDRLQLLKGS